LAAIIISSSTIKTLIDGGKTLVYVVIILGDQLKFISISCVRRRGNSKAIWIWKNDPFLGYELKLHFFTEKKYFFIPHFPKLKSGLLCGTDLNCPLAGKSEFKVRFMTVAWQGDPESLISHFIDFYIFFDSPNCQTAKVGRVLNFTEVKQMTQT
jgi:hypothetical protein